MADSTPAPDAARLTRRGFVAGSAALAAVGALAGDAAAASPRAVAAALGRGRTPRHLRRATYAALETPTFEARGPGGVRIRLELDEVADLPRATVEPQLRRHDEAFRLHFTGPAWMPLDQGTHPLRHGEIGSFELFLVPRVRDGWTIGYEAIVDRLVPRRRRRRPRRRRRRKP